MLVSGLSTRRASLSFHENASFARRWPKGIRIFSFSCLHRSLGYRGDESTFGLFRPSPCYGRLPKEFPLRTSQHFRRFQTCDPIPATRYFGMRLGFEHFGRMPKYSCCLSHKFDLLIDESVPPPAGQGNRIVERSFPARWGFKRSDARGPGSATRF